MTFRPARQDEDIRVREQFGNVAALACEPNPARESERADLVLERTRSGPSPTITASNDPGGSFPSARTKVMKSLGALRRPTARNSGHSRSVVLGRRTAGRSTAFGITIVRSAAQVFAASPARRSFSDTQIVTVVSGSTRRSTRR